MKKRVNLTIDSKLYERIEDYANNTRRTISAAIEWLVLKGFQSEIDNFRYYIYEPFKEALGEDEAYKLILDYLNNGQVNYPLIVHNIDNSIYFMSEDNEASLVEMLNKDNFLEMTMF